MKGAFVGEKPLGRAIFCLILLVLFCAAGGAKLHAGDIYRVKQAITVGNADSPVQLKIGDTVEVLSVHGTQAVIMVTTSGGNKTVCQASMDALEPNTPAAGTAVNAGAMTPTILSPQVKKNPEGRTTAKDLPESVVVIKGDNAEGTGFLVKTANGPAVITNIHVISANPNLKILTTSGEQIKVLSLKGASDRDLAMFMIQDNNYTYLYLADQIKDTVQAGDEVITPGNSEGGEVVLTTQGTVLGIGPEKVEISNPVYHGNSGGPVFHTKTGQVVAVVTQGIKNRLNNELDQASFKNKNSAITGDMRYFGLRLDNVPMWEDYDWNRFLAETTFLNKFHQESRCLDSFMNGAQYEKLHLTEGDGESGEPDSKFYLRDEKIQSASQSFHQLTDGGDKSARLDAARGLIMDLQGVADDGMTTMQNPSAFYFFNQLRATEEVKYRQELRKEIDNTSDRVSDLGH